MKKKSTPEKPVDDISKKLELADNWLTKLEVILKKHWGKLILLLVVYFIYWALSGEPVLYPDATFQAMDTSAYYYQDSVVE